MYVRCQVCPEKEELESWIIKDMDRLLGEAWLTGNEDVFQQIFHLILNENVSGKFVPCTSWIYPSIEMSQTEGVDWWEIVKCLQDVVVAKNTNFLDTVCVNVTFSACNFIIVLITQTAQSAAMVSQCSLAP